MIFIFLHSDVPEVVRVIFYTHQNGGACAGACASDRTHQMDKIVNEVIFCDDL